MLSVGFDDSRIHRSYICRIRGINGNGQDVAVNGLLSEGYNLQSASNYGQPLLDFTVGQKMASVGAIAQVLTEGMTSQTLANSIQIYENETPIMMTLPLSFIALRDPVKEVSQAERYLLEMKAPQLAKGALLEAKGGDDVAVKIEIAKSLLSEVNPFSIMERMKNSRRPKSVSVTIAKHIMFPECLISDVEITDESVNHKSGHALQKTINVTIIFQRTINNTEFAKFFPS
ncbi:hypothetical protein KAR91_55695 [Candidatus Pacearchaeota archaeon]|nr:hypothetical protein [Candidatus Pacearchaeota archaeon]